MNEWRLRGFKWTASLLLHDYIRQLVVRDILSGLSPSGDRGIPGVVVPLCEERIAGPLHRIVDAPISHARAPAPAGQLT